MDLMHSLTLVAPEELLSVFGLILLLCAAWAGDKAARPITWLSVAVLTVCALMTAPTLCAGAKGAETLAFGGQLRVDAFAAYAKLLIYAAAGASLLVAPAFFGSLRQFRAEYPILVLFAVLGMGVMVSAHDFMALYIGLELNSLASYVLASMLRNDRRSAEAGLKYFVLGALASGILLFGMSLTYGFSGTTSFDGIRAALESNHAIGAAFGLVFVLAGLAFKISAAPFHMWTPDVYEGAPTPVTMFFASAPKVAAMALLTRVAMDAFASQVHAWQPIVMFVAVVSIVWGALGAIGQGNIKRLLAFSSINNVGFILIGLAAASPAGIAGVLIYLTIYVAMTIGGFVAVLMLRDERGEYIEGIPQLAGLSRHRKMLAGCLAVIMFSLAGIPPLFGFWGKFVVFQAAVKAGLMPLAVVGILGSVIGAYYYLRVIKVMYFDEPANVVTGKSDWIHQALLALSAAFVAIVGFFVTPWLTDLATKAAAALLHTV